MADHSAASSSWSELPWDLLDRIMQHLELPEALAVASVCASWRAAAAAGRSSFRHAMARAPAWRSFSSRENGHGRNTAQPVSKPPRYQQEVHGESIVPGAESPRLVWSLPRLAHRLGRKAPELLQSPTVQPLHVRRDPSPAHHRSGRHHHGLPRRRVNIIGYHYEEYDEILVRLPHKFTSEFFDKVVLSCDPSRGGADCIAMAIYGLNQVSFARPGDSSWRLAPIAQMGTDKYTDCVYHNGRFYAVTMNGPIETWDLGTGPSQDPKKHVIIDTEPGIKKDMGIHDRFLVSTPWGALLQIRVLLHNLIKFRNKRMNVEVLQVDVEKHKLVKLSPSTAFRGHAVGFSNRNAY
ncbi:hypothetical protein QYE76_063273 [Lolium multiflorum]|uniref:F-box domain-containing protein n=1 Tax=Lolium multiflorum TaxID=4521 RepID=A0AAD8W6V8_LOLMU|nr:hypothetical protein QYE76_063273 [Lolium multiflorum]